MIVKAVKVNGSWWMDPASLPRKLKYFAEKTIDAVKFCYIYYLLYAISF